MNINLLTAMAMVILIVGIGFVVQNSTDHQEIRSRAAGSEITFVSSSHGDTGQTANATSVTLPKPSGVQAGDVIVALIQADYGHIGGTLPAGWVLITERNESDDLAAHTYYKIASSSEPANYTWTIINTDPTKKAQKHEALGGGTLLAFRGVDTKKPVFASAINPETADTTKVACPSVNATAGSMLLCQFTDDDPGSFTIPSSMTGVSNFILRSNDSHAAAYEKIANAGQTGTRVSSIAVPADQQGKTNNDIGIGIVLQPSSSASTSVQPSTSVPPSTYCLGCSPGGNVASPSAVLVSPAAIPVVPATDEKSKSFITLFLLMLQSLFKLFGDIF